MKELELSLRIRNNRLKERREELGKTPKQIAKDIGVSYAYYLTFESMTVSPLSTPRKAFGKYAVTQQSPWKPVVHRMADYYGVPPQELFPLAVLTQKERTHIKKVDAVEIVHMLPCEMQALPAPSEDRESTLSAKEMEAALNECLTTLTSREADVLVMRFGLNGGAEHTLHEVAGRLGCSRERARQLQERALHKVRAEMYERGVLL
jgi:RNA polymerase sigma factor (sigma-70 family)